MSLEKFFKEQPTQGGYELFKQLFAEANTQLGFFKLPNEFVKYREIIYKQVYLKIKDEYAKDPRIAQKEEMIKNQTRDLNQFYSLGTDFQKYKYNEGAVKPLDMLAQSDQNIKEIKSKAEKEKEKQFKTKEEFDEWFNKYYELESLKKEYPDKTPELNKAQKELNDEKFEKHKQELMINTKGKIIPRNQVEMDYILLSKDNTPFPLKLSNKVKLKEIEDLGFQEIGMIELHKNEDGTYEPSTDPDKIEEIKNKTAEFFKDTQEEINKGKEEHQKNRKRSFYYEKNEETQEDKERIARVMKVDKALQDGVEIDDELYYQYLDEFPSYRKKLAKIQLFREQQKEEKKQEEARMQHLEENYKANEQTQKEYLEKNKDAIREQEVEKAIDTIMKDEWNRVRIAQTLAKREQKQKLDEKIKQYTEE